MVRPNRKKPFTAVLVALFLLLSLVACADDSAPVGSVQLAGTPVAGAAPAENTATAMPTPLPTATLPPPSPTPQLAALVNGQPILLEAFNEEVARYEAAQAELGLTPGADGFDYRRLVLDSLIEKEVLRQAALASGGVVTEQMVDDRLDQLREAAAEHVGFDAWLAANRWTPETFRAALADEMMVETMIASITSDVPYTAEQVRARYIQVDDAALAESLLAQINEGGDFGELAAANSRDLITGPAGGDLGFFARGSLLVPEVEEAAFALQPEQVSEVIAVADEQSGQMVYYIVQVTERDPQRPLSNDRRAALLQATYETWLAEQLSRANVIEMLDQ